MQTEPMLLQRAAQGDSAAFEALLATRQHNVYALCLRMMGGSRQDALDMAQEALLRVYRNLGAFKGQADFTTWVYRITTNVCIDELRKRKRNKAVSMDALRETGFEPVDKGPTPEQEALRAEGNQELAHAIGELPEEQRAAVVLRDVQGLSYEQVAEALGLNLNTTKSRISRGRRHLRELLNNMRNKSAIFTSNGV